MFKKFFQSKRNIVILILVLVIIAETSVALGLLFKPKDSPTIGRTSTAVIRGKVLTDVGEMIGANIIVEDSNGKTKLYTTNAFSTYEIELEEGTYKLHFTRGMLWSTTTKQITVVRYQEYLVEDIRLVRLYNAEDKFFYAGDLHQHTFFSDGSDSVEQIALADIAMGLSWALLTDHNDNTGSSEWLQCDRLVYDINNGVRSYFTPVPGVEITTSYGHFQSIGVNTVVEEWEIELDKGENPYTEVGVVLEEMHRTGALVQLNHPFSTGTMGFNNYQDLWDYIDQFETIEIWNGYFEPCGYIATDNSYNQNRESMLKWFELLNDGHRLFATGGTDIHSTQGYFNPDLCIGESKAYLKALKQAGQYAGMPTNYVYLPSGVVTADGIVDAVRAGNNFISNGPVIFTTINGKTYGQTTSISEGTTVNLEAFCREGLDRINIIKNGITIHTIDNLTDTDYANSVNLSDIVAGDWIVIEVYAQGVYYAITNPIFFE